MYKHILCPTDLSPRSINALKTAFDLSALYESKLSIINSQLDLNSPEERIMSRVSVKKRIEDNRLLAESIKKEIKEISRKFSFKANYDFYLREGKADQVILDFAVNFKIDLIVMGTNGADSLSDIFLGSTASNVIKSAVCPILVIPNIK